MERSQAKVIYDKVQALPESAQSAVLRVVESLGGGETESETLSSSRLAQEFRTLAETWRRETAFFSFMPQRALHPADQRIIGMGWGVVPLLLRDLRRQPDHWLWALQAITGERPAQGAETLAAATEAWLNWGQARGLLSDAQG